MSTPMPTRAPAGYVPEVAVSFADAVGSAVPVDGDHPLPVRSTIPAATAAPLVGSLAQTGLVGPFTPDLGRPIWVTLSGAWTGSVAVLRSVDGGATKLPLTVVGQPWAVFTAPAQEPVEEETVAGAAWYLSATLSSGALDYEVRQ